MTSKKINTTICQIAVSIEKGGAGDPLVFLHGVFLDKSLWSAFDTSLTGRTHIYIDLPAHGESSSVGRDWSLDECVSMLIQILDELEIAACIAVGHSWGSMTALRAAANYPLRFSALCLCNMPFRKTEGIKWFAFQLQKLLTGFQGFYAGQAAKSLYSGEFLRAHPEYSKQMQERLSKRSGKEIARVIDAVILDPEDGTILLENLKTPALAVVGESDFVGLPPNLQTMTVPGGHISPHEAPEQLKNAIKQVLKIARKTS